MTAAALQDLGLLTAGVLALLAAVGSIGYALVVLLRRG
jgi:hypothetical protein